MADIIVKQVTRNITVHQVGRRGPQGPPGSSANLYGLYKTFAADLDTIIAGDIVRDSNGAAISAEVIWPDGETGTYTATEVSTDFPGAIDAYTVTYTGSPNKTFTQAAVTRDTTGAVIFRPAIGVA